MPTAFKRPTARRKAPARNAQLCVVLVDDETGYLDILQQLLSEHLSCKVHGFNSPRAALAALPRLRVGLIVTDFNMPGMNGLEFVAAAQRIVPGVSAVMITAYQQAFTAAELAAVPALKSVVAKPFRWIALAEQIDRHWPEGSSPPFSGAK